MSQNLENGLVFARELNSATTCSRILPRNPPCLFPKIVVISIMCAWERERDELDGGEIY